MGDHRAVARRIGWDDTPAHPPLSDLSPQHLPHHSNHTCPNVKRTKNPTTISKKTRRKDVKRRSKCQKCSICSSSSHSTRAHTRDYKCTVEDCDDPIGHDARSHDKQLSKVQVARGHGRCNSPDCPLHVPGTTAENKLKLYTDEHRGKTTTVKSSLQRICRIHKSRSSYSKSHLF